MKLGISPFMKIFRGKSVIHACIEGNQIQLLRYLLKDSKRSAQNNKYSICDSNRNSDYYWKSRKAKDNFGNNYCHFAFKVGSLMIKYQVLPLLVEEECGDLSKRNKMGL